MWGTSSDYGNGSGRWEGSRCGLEEEGLVPAVLGFGDGRRGLGTDRTWVLTNSQQLVCQY